MTASLLIAPLTSEAFRPYGDVIGVASALRGLPINGGRAERLTQDVHVDTSAENGRTSVAIVRATAAAMSPFRVVMLERHVLGSQAFVPLQRSQFVVIVARYTGLKIDLADIRAFRTDGSQGINYRRGVWHHPLIALSQGDEFLVIDREGPLADFETCDLDNALDFHLHEDPPPQPR